MKIHTVEECQQCSICDKSYSCNRDLEIHMTIHISVKTYQCSLCENSYLRNEDLTSHLTTHTFESSPTNSYQIGEMPYICRLCETPFLTRPDLKIHMMTHSEEKKHINTVSLISPFQNVVILVNIWIFIQRKIHINAVNVMNLFLTDTDMNIHIKHTQEKYFTWIIFIIFF